MNPDPAALPLRDIHLPTVVSWWPPAPGWWYLAGTLLLLAAGAAWLWRRHRRYRTRRAALVALNRIEAAYAADRDAHALARALSQLLRRVALVYAGPSAAAATGEQWLAVLARLSGEPWPATTAHVLLVAPYSATVAQGVEAPVYASAMALARHCFAHLPALPVRQAHVPV